MALSDAISEAIEQMELYAAREEYDFIRLRLDALLNEMSAVLILLDTPPTTHEAGRDPARANALLSTPPASTLRNSAET